MSKEFNPGKLKPIIKTVAYILEREPGLHNDYDALIKKVEEEIPELKNKKRCPNCDASMSQYVYDINTVDIALVVGMAQSVKEARADDKSFTEANNVHVPTLNVCDAARRDITRCSKLGLIAKFLKDGRHVGGRWVITRRGFEALRGEAVPTGIISWRNTIIERSTKLITFNEVIKNAKNIRHREVANYNQNDWVEIAGFQDGKLF